jgi:hypothetical protein
MKKATREITTVRGAKIAIEVCRGYRQYSEAINADGNIVTVAKKDVVESQAITLTTADGRVISGLYVTAECPTEAQAKAGGALVLRSEQISVAVCQRDADNLLAAIKSATTEAEADNAEMDAIKQQRADAAEYRAAQRRIDKIMSM